ncbi:MAG: DUF6603 domain-containing protein, partial [Bacteroidota bacterium]
TATLADYEIDVSLTLPALVVRGELRKSADTTLPSPLSLLDRLEAGPGAAKATDVSSGSASLELGRINLMAAPLSRSATFFLQLDRWTIGPVDLAAQLQLDYHQGEIAGSLAANFAFRAGGHDYLVGLSGAHAGAGQGWLLEGGLAVDELTLDELIGYFAGAFSVSGDTDLGFDTRVALKYLFLSVDTGSQHYRFTVDFTIADPVAADITLVIDLAKTGSGYSRSLSGHLELGAANNKRVFDLVFGLERSSGGSSQQLIALYRKDGGEVIPLADLLSAMIPGEEASIPDLSFKINNALLVLLKEADGTKKYLFTSEMDFGLDLSGLQTLPLIGSVLPQDESLKLHFQPLLSPEDDGTATSQKLVDPDLTAIKALLPEGSPPLPDTVTGGLGLLTTLQIGSFRRTLTLGMGGDQVDSDLGTVANTSTPAGVTTPAAGGGASAPVSAVPDDDLQWVELGRTFGPLHLARLGVGFANGQIDAVFDAGIAVGPLTVALLGLGAHYRLADKHLSFSLEGVGIDFRRGPLEISGAFMRLEDEFVGRVTVKMETFGITALGAYGELEGHPSLFLYAYLDLPLGGPVFFFVEGLAFGFGFNRRLIVPPIADIERFPLVSVAMGTTQPPDGLTGGGDDFIDGLREE